MNELQKEKLSKIIYNFSSLLNVNNEDEINNLLESLYSMNINDVIDFLIVRIYDLLDTKRITMDNVKSNMELLTSLSEKYTSFEDLINRLNWLKSMNMIYTKMPLTENHELVLEVFDKFNELIGTDYDTYYTGGLMGYLATNHPLERYHSDLDLFINEAELGDLYKLVNDSEDFEFISNMDDKEDHGHEFKIQYRDTPMSIGLFLFERKEDNEIVIKEYYYKDKNPEEELLVDEQHLMPEYAGLIFGENIGEHNGLLYRVQSLESIYNIKKAGRPKDEYDAKIIKSFIDLDIDRKLDKLKDFNYENKRVEAINSIVDNMIDEMKNDKKSIRK